MGKFLVILIPDSNVTNTEKIISEIKKFVNSDCQFAQFHIDKDTIHLHVSFEKLGVSYMIAGKSKRFV